MVQNWPVPRTFEDTLRAQQRRLMHEERRPLVRNAADLMGPSLGPRAILVVDWNTDEAAFNGILYSSPGAQNSPDGAAYWMGWTAANDGGYGIQHLFEFRTTVPMNDPMREAIRRFYDPGSGALRAFSDWQIRTW
jgi:hypothetical protein